MRFHDELHTPQALAGEIGSIYNRQPETVLLGSLGRAVIYGQLLDNPYAEFDARAQTPVQKKEYGEALARDIDVAGVSGVHNGLEGPFEIDSKAFDSRQVSLQRQGGDWFLASESKGTYEQLHPAVMEPVTGETVYGSQVITVPYQTHLALFGLKGAMRPKDKQNHDHLAAAGRLSVDKLPDELFEPFDRLRLIANSGWLHHSRQLYRLVVPGRMRRKLGPYTSIIKDRLA